jgi:beta-ribofuranosylaminobenzene 5'-phosphate synthase
MNIQTIIHTQINKVTVTTSARLHMGFFDLNGATGRMFGSVGVSLDAPETIIEIAKCEKRLIDAKNQDYVAKIVDNLTNTLKIDKDFSVKILQNIPQHAGLGSGTQMALAIGAALNTLFSLDLSAAQIASASQRGARSGIGIGAFEQGGFLVDFGKILHGKTTKIDNSNVDNSDELPNIALRHDFPADWRVLLVSDAAHTGVHGAAESQAFRTLQPASNNLRDMVFKHMAPALQRADLLAFGGCMVDLQAYNGEYFAPIQGGYYASLDVAAVLVWLQKNGAACMGQSSWGPTGFAIFENQQQAESLLSQAQLAFASKANISFELCCGKNTGAAIQLT